ncbi:pyrroloquinoline quinone biosynthesis protein PqqE [Lichenihabitans psoromatis]|uniref:pyrroloquinoline quinone biosynthesis protein PqqE n=1 Tax=Lichenihabitans psoromatis TaxID=2528642 RepID=UPI0010385615|nr:pyrroloquinoline quinone biosynthesis protein PqqE [Lichenihabitans psoromatis]
MTVAPPPAPFGLLAELTHRCPLACPYCSNPLALDAKSGELDTETWTRVFSEASALGVLHIHLSGGEPLARRDIVDLVAHCAKLGLYTNLITSGIGLTEDRMARLSDAGLDHVQLSVQDVDPASADRIAGYAGAFAKKQQVAAWVTAAGLPLTVNAVIHRANVARAPDLVALAIRLGARRVEIAHTQYYGWASVNRDALMPSRAEAEVAVAEIERLKTVHAGTIVIDHVVPDYHARYPKACMGGWAMRSLNVTPSGKVLPCHAAETLPGLTFPTVHEASLAAIWTSSEAFNAYRGTDWMQEPCRSCVRKAVDVGGCRCQAFALTGDARNTDPVCVLSPLHDAVTALATPAHDADTGSLLPTYTYRANPGPSLAPLGMDPSINAP